MTAWTKGVAVSVERRGPVLGVLDGGKFRGTWGQSKGETGRQGNSQDCGWCKLRG